MLFDALTVFGLVAVATAVPTIHSRFEKGYAKRDVTRAAERGLILAPRSLEARADSNGNSWNNFGSSFSEVQLIQEEQIIILTLQQQQLEQAILQQEIELQLAIQERIRANLQLQFALDNIRINTFNNINQNLNTVVVIVTQVIDNRVQNNQNSRYFYRQIQSNRQATEQVFVQIQEQSVLTIDTGISASVQSRQDNSTVAATPQIGSFTPNGTLSLQQQGIYLLPSGQGVPQFSNAQTFSDPALIVQQNQQAFVSFGANSNEFVTSTSTTIVQTTIVN